MSLSCLNKKEKIGVGTIKKEIAGRKTLLT